MQIKQISVAGLFGIFDHVIPLNTNERITIIHGPNGFGKTAILRLLNGFFNSQHSALWSIPFKMFQIDIDNGITIELVKEFEDSNTEDVFLTCNFKHKNSKQTVYISKNNFDDDNQKRYAMFRDSQLSPLEKSQETLKKVQSSRKIKNSSKEAPDWLQDLRKSLHIYLIESQRLLNSIPNKDSPNKYPKIVTLGSWLLEDSSKSSMSPTVSAYSDELAQLMRDKFTEYGVIAQSLDRTFPTRLFQKETPRHLTEEKLRNQLIELEETRSRLVEVGLLDKNEASDSQIQPQSAIDESTKGILSVYVDDVEKKLSVFDDIADKIGLLRKIINHKFAYSHKEMNFNKEKGFVFKTLYSAPVHDSEILSPTDLSSGEQHELVLLYELLFKVQPNSLVLIDEPELSLHVGWQSQFLKDLKEITQLADLDVLMATHSPDIIQDRWDLTVELKGPAQ